MVDRRVLQTIIAEAGGDPEAMAAVAAVINNRAQATGKTPLQVVKAKGQFEGYSNPGPAISSLAIISSRESPSRTYPCPRQARSVLAAKSEKHG